MSAHRESKSKNTVALSYIASAQAPGFLSSVFIDGDRKCVSLSYAAIMTFMLSSFSNIEAP